MFFSFFLVTFYKAVAIQGHLLERALSAPYTGVAQTLLAHAEQL